MDIHLFEWELAVTQKRINDSIASSTTLLELIEDLQLDGSFSSNLVKIHMSDMLLFRIRILRRIDDGAYNHILLECEDITSGDSLFVKLALIRSDEVDRRHLFSKYEKGSWFVKPKLLLVYENGFVVGTPFVKPEHEVNPNLIRETFSCWKKMLECKLFYEDWESPNMTEDGLILDIDTKIITSDNYLSNRPSDDYPRRWLMSTGVIARLTMFNWNLTKQLKNVWKYSDLMQAENFIEFSDRLQKHMNAIECLIH